MVDKSTFGRLLSYGVDGQSTLDNADSVHHHLETVWMQRLSVQHLKSADRDSVFNTLLHFSTEALVEKNLEPVCRYEYLLRWHDLCTHLSEDLFTTSFLAARDLYNRKHRYSFCWLPTIGHDNRTLNEIFKRPMMDLHFHINGSSLNFDINWMSLMNKTSGWSKTFKKLRDVKQEVLMTTDGQACEPLYLCVIKASALRVLLFEYVINQYNIGLIPSADRSLAEQILEEGSTDAAITYAIDLDVTIQRLRCLYGKRYSSDDGSVRIPDYATLDRLTNGIDRDSERHPLTVLSGERWMMYEIFRNIYSNPQIDKQIVGWFYAYLLYKAHFRSEMIQNNSVIGFANFSQYEKRKSLFIKQRSVYDTLLSQLAVTTFLNAAENRQLEIRVAPKESTEDLIRSIRKVRSFITDQHFVSKRVKGSINQRYSLILHFIKSKDDDVKDAKIRAGKCRHYNLRYKVKRQAHAIRNLRLSLNAERNCIVGIDAANSEIYARPEVFAQAFRFLRECTEEIPGGEMLPDLGMTYHVGEDFLDVVDGLRAVDELIIYMNFRDGDRIGHGMVLGIDVVDYYARSHNNIILPSQVLLDNVVWLYCKGKNLSEFTPASKDLEVLFDTYYQKIYGHLNIQTTIWSYYLSWLLRGDNPQLYFLANRNGKHSQNSKWSMFSQNDNQMVRNASLNQTACDLYSAYHFDPAVRRKGLETVFEKLSDNVVKYVVAVQKQMLDEIERANIRIECNPTSNLKIGQFDSYSTHPIIRMYNDRLPIEADPHSISVTINTDDMGIFSTSLEREYSLLALSLGKKYVREGVCTPRAIYEWIDRIRQMSEEQVFDKP